MEGRIIGRARGRISRQLQKEQSVKLGPVDRMPGESDCRKDIGTQVVARSHMMAPGNASTFHTHEEHPKGVSHGETIVTREALRAQSSERVQRRPKNVLSETGKSGRQVQIRLKTSRNGVFYQDQVVDFILNKEDQTGDRRALMRIRHTELHGGELYQISSHHPLPNTCKEQVQILRVIAKLWADKLKILNNLSSKVAPEISNRTMPTLLEGFQEERSYSSSLDAFHKLWKSSTLGLVIRMEHNNRIYRVDDVDFEKSPQSTFLWKGKETTYKNFYKERYNLEITMPTQPLIISRSKPRGIKIGDADLVYLVPELCRIIRYSDITMKADTRLRKAVANHTRVGPSSRAAKLLAFSNRLKETDQSATSLDNKCSPMMAEMVEPIFIRPSHILLGIDGQERAQFFKYECFHPPDYDDHLLLPPKPTTNPELQARAVIDCIIFAPQFNNETQHFIDLVQDKAFDMEIHIRFIDGVKVHDEANYLNTLDEFLSTKRTQFVVCVVTNHKVRSAIKKFCVLDRSVSCQIVDADKMKSHRVALSIAIKVALLVNCKLQRSPRPVSQLKGAMVVGCEVSHDTENIHTSYGTMVASLNNTQSRYYCAVFPHQNEKDLSNQIALNMVKAINAFKSQNEGFIPNRIIFYRSGVEEDMLKHVQEMEVFLLKEKLGEVYGNAYFRLNYIVISKRYDTRFADENEYHSGTIPQVFKFFIITQSVNASSVSPTTCIVLHNTDLTPEYLQRITYHMCHLYNWSGTMKVPAPVHYAYKLAIFCSHILHRVPPTDLEDLLFLL